MANQSLPEPEQFLAAHGFDLWIPDILTPGGLALVSPSGSSEAFRSFEMNPQVRLWYVRGELGEQPLPSSLESFPKRLLTKPPNEKVFVSTLGSRLYQGHLAFEAFSNEHGDIVEFGLYVEAMTPCEAVANAREPFGEFLEELAFWTHVPLQFRQFSVATDKADAPLAFEINIPFGTTIGCETTWLPPLNHTFTAANALLREAAGCDSPYYRLSCAFRLMDAIDWIRKDLGNAAKHLEKTVNFPNLPKISVTGIYKRGATVTEKLKKVPEIGLRELFKAWTAKRNAISHFVFEKENKKHFLIPSIGKDYRDFACSAAILLLYSRKALQDLREFSREYLEPKPDSLIIDTPHSRDVRSLGALMQQRSRFGWISLANTDQSTTSETDQKKKK